MMKKIKEKIIEKIERVNKYCENFDETKISDESKIFILVFIAVFVSIGAEACDAVFAYGYAADPISTVNKLSDFIFSLIRAIGLILLGLGIMQVGLSMKSHDPSQRANGFLTVAGGIIITFTKESAYVRCYA